MAGAFNGYATHSEPAAEADLPAVGRALWNKKALILGPTLLAAVIALFVTGSMTPQYRSQAQVLVESNDTIYTRPGPENAQGADKLAADELAVQSQVQLLMSRDLARAVVKKLNLAETDEFDPAGGAVGLIKRIMILIGLSRDPMRMNTEERVLDTFFEGLSVYAVPSSRVIVVEYSSVDPERAALIANTTAEKYLELQQEAKQTTTRRASDWLGTQIKDLSGRVVEAEAKVEEFRAKENLFAGSNNTTVSTQQLGELNTELSRARAQQSDAGAKAAAIKDSLKAGRLESLDIQNSELLRALAQQRVGLASTMAREGRVYLPGHPRMKELAAQQDSLDAEIRAEALKLSRAYENEANVAASRVAAVQASIDAQKKVSGSASEQEVQLRALDREAKAQRDLLEQFLARYRDAVARERVEAIPPDARIISRASPTNTPYSPKPLAITILAAVATFILLVVGFTASEFMIVPAGTGTVPSAPPPVNPYARPGDPPPANPYARADVPSAPPRERAFKLPKFLSGRRAPPEPVTYVPVPTPPAAPPQHYAPPQNYTPPQNFVPPAPVSPAPPPAPAAAPLFGRTQSPAADNIEAAGMSVLGDLAKHLAATPKGDDGALNILSVSSSSNIDPGNVALTLARALTEAGRKVIVADAGSQSPEYLAALPNPGEWGLGELIAGKTSFGQAIQRDRVSAAHLIAPGAANMLNPAAYARIGIVLDALGLTYDFVVVLSPPADRANDMAALAKKTDAAILVSNTQDAATIAAHRALTAAGVGDVIVLLTDPQRRA
jgi:succinoglycan biosynthesis transport protein ExoP